MEAGDRVRHPSWGKGTVVQRTGHTAMHYELVRFDDGTQRRVGRYALEAEESAEEQDSGE